MAYLDTIIAFAAIMLGLSLLITILAQTISAIAGFRGASLRWGLSQLFKHIDPVNLPTIHAQAEQIATEILSRKLASDSIFSSIGWIQKVLPEKLVSRFQLASAIRCDELVGILQQWTLSPPESLKIPANEIIALLEAINPAIERRINLLTGTSAGLRVLPLDRAPALIEETVKSIAAAGGNLEAWFQTSMDRVSQQFTMYMRTWTIIFSFGLAALTGIDAIQLARALYKEGDFRTALAATAPGLMEQAGKILPPSNGSDANPAFMVTNRLLADAIAKALANSGVTMDAKPVNIITRDEAMTWIRKNVTNPSQQTATLHAFPEAADQVFDEYIQENANNAAIIKARLAPINRGWPNGFNWRQLFGVLATGALLSLGAPFWFNSLKSVTNLRSTLADKIKEGEKASS